MTIQKNFRILSEIIDFFLNSELPADVFLNIYYKKNRFIGSKERKLLSESFYHFIRNYILIDKLTDSLLPETSNRTAKYIIINFIISELELNTHSKLKTLSHYNKLKNSNFQVFYDLLSLFREFAPNCQIKSTIKEIRHSIYTLNENIANQSLEVEKRISAFATRYSFDKSISAYIYNNVYRDFDSMTSFAVDSFNQAKTTIRINSKKSFKERIINELKNNNIAYSISQNLPASISLEKRINMPAMQFFKKGLAEIQDEGSQIIAYALNPEPNANILDACAGAGGKTLHLSDLTQGTAKITSCDISSRKLEELQKRAKRNKFSNITTHIIKDSQKDNFFDGKNFDYVLVDAPCSGFGTIRRNPEKKYKLNMQKITQITSTQIKILEYYAQFTKIGGFLLYATCSILPDENENTVKLFLQNNPDFVAAPLKRNLDKFNLSNNLSDQDYYITILPDDFGSDGFFISLLQRQKN